MYYLTFLLLMFTSYLQWKSLQKLKKLDEGQRKRHIIVTFVYGMGFLIRAVYNTIQSVFLQEIINFRKDPFDWNIFLVSYHLLAEFIPMTIVFSFQIHTNRKRYFTKLQYQQMLEYGCGGMEENGSVDDLRTPKEMPSLNEIEQDNDVESYYDEDIKNEF